MKTLKTREELILSATKKLQTLTKFGLSLHSDTGKPIENIHQAAIRLVDDTTYMIKCTLPDDHACLCISLSNNALAQMKTYLSESFLLEQQTSSKHYLLCGNIKEEFELLTQSDDIQIVDNIEFVCNYNTLPTYTNKGNLYSVYIGPILTDKTVFKICNLSEKMHQNKDTYYLLSDNIRAIYNAPMSILRHIGQGVLSLNALNLLELILCFATNSSAVFDKKSAEPLKTLKPFRIPFYFFANEYFELNQSIDEISSSLDELRSKALINSYTFNTDTVTFDIFSNVIQNSIRQHDLVQKIGYYKAFNLQQQEYCYTFINYLLYCVGSIKAKQPKSSSDDETQVSKPKPKLKVCLGKLLNYLDEEEHLHDHARLAQVLNNCREAGRKARLLEPFYEPLAPNDVKKMLAYPDSLHDYFVVHIATEEEKQRAELFKQVIEIVNQDILPREGRTYLQNR